MRNLGRLVCRGDNIVGLYFPYGSEKDNLYGIYEIQEIMGELRLKKLGDPAMKQSRFTGLDTEGLIADRTKAVLTEKEYLEVCK